MFHIVERSRVEIDAFIIYCWAVCVCVRIVIGSRKVITMRR